VVSVAPYGHSRSGGTDQRGFALSPDGKLLALGAGYGRFTRGKTPAVHLWDADSGDEGLYRVRR
jgi:hypothetical protein